MDTTTLASVLEQDLAGVTDTACARIRRCLPHAQDDPAAEHLESYVGTGLDAFSRAWARQRPLADEELAEATRWCDRSSDGLPREVLLHAYRVVVDVVRDHIERRVEELGPRLTEPSEVMSLLGQLGLARSLERQLTDAVEAATTVRLDASRRDWMFETLEAYLDAGSSVTAAARALCLHRESARYRITKLRDLFGSDLDDPDRRLALHLAVKALRHGLSPAAAGDDVAAARG